MKKNLIFGALLTIAALCLAACTKPFEDLNPSISPASVTINSGEIATVSFKLNDVRGNAIKTVLDYNAPEKYEITVNFPSGSESGTLTIKAPEKIYVATPFDVKINFSDATSGRSATSTVTVRPVMKPLEDLSPVFDPAEITVKDGEKPIVTVKLNDVRGNKIDWDYKIEGDEWYMYSLWCEMADNMESGKIRISAPGIITSSTPFNIKMTFTDKTNGRSSTGNIVVNPVISDKYVVCDEHANSFVVAPGTLVKFPLFKGNSDEKASIDNLVLGWEDTKGLYQRYQVLDGQTGYAVVRFNDGIEGNAVLNGLYDGKVVWSWHFWVCADAPKDVTVGEYTFLDRNIGALNLDEKSELSVGVIYQYGRKDPMPSIKYTAYEMRNAYDIDDKEVTITIKQNEELDNLENAIQNPTIFYNNKNYTGQKHNYSWITTDCTQYGSEKFKTLWENDGRKSVYDPCPAGYKVAPTAAWTAVQATTDVQQLWDSSYETFDKDKIGTNEKYIAGNKKKVQFRGCIYNGLRLTVTGEMNSTSDKFSFANCMGTLNPVFAVWCSDVDPDFATKLNVSNFRGRTARISVTGNGNYDDVSAVKANALSVGTKYGLNYALPVRCIKE